MKTIPDQKNDRLSQEEIRGVKTLHGEVNEDIQEWLQRSLVCTSDEPRDLGSLASSLHEDFGL